VAKLADLGFAREINPSKQSALSGTPIYFAPERLRYETFSYPADIWALGMCLYELLSGEDHFPFPIVVDSIINKQAEPLPDFVPAFFSKVVFCMLEKNPEIRITSIDAMKDLLTGNAIQKAVALEQIPNPTSIKLPLKRNREAVSDEESKNEVQVSGRSKRPATEADIESSKASRADP